MGSVFQDDIVPKGKVDRVPLKISDDMYFDKKWGESPCAFVTLKDEEAASEAEIIEYCRLNMAGFKVPKTVIFGPLPKTSTGKIQKFLLREQAKELGEKSDE